VSIVDEDKEMDCGMVIGAECPVGCARRNM